MVDQMTLDVPQDLRPQRIVTLAGNPVTGKLAAEARQLGRPIRCCACANDRPPPDELIYSPGDSGGLLFCYGHLPASARTSAACVHPPANAIRSPTDSLLPERGTRIMTSKPKLSAPAAAVEILKAEGGPLHVKVITERVMDQYETGLKGKTPIATLGAKLHTSAKKGDTFRKVAPGTFELIDPSGETPTPAEPATEETPADGETPEETPADTPADPVVEDEPSAAVTPNAVVVRRGKTQVKPDPKTKGATTRRRGGKVAVQA